MGAVCGYACDCFLAGSVVETSHGKRPIESVQVGDFILSSDLVGQRGYRRVTDTYAFLRTDYLVINDRLRTTASQPIRVTRRAPGHARLISNEPVPGPEWIRASDLAIGDEMHGLDADEEIVSIQRVRRGVRVYNLEVDEDHTFFVDGFLVHNKEPCKEFKGRRAPVTAPSPWGRVKTLYR